MILSRFSKRERIILIATLVVIIASVFSAFVLEPLVRNFKDVNRQIASKRLKLIKSERLMKLKDRVHERFEALSPKLTAEGSQEEEMAKLLSEIETLARKSNTRISGIKPAAIKKFSAYKKLTVEIDSETTVDSLIKLLYELQQSPQVLKVERLQMDAKSGGRDLLKVTLRVNKILLN